MAKKMPTRKSMAPSHPRPALITPNDDRGYEKLLSGLSRLLDDARRGVARTVNAILTATNWEIGRRIVEFEQGGKVRAEYGEALLQRLANDLSKKHGRGFSRPSLQRMRAFYLGWEIRSTPLSKFVAQIRTHSDREKDDPGITVFSALTGIDTGTLTTNLFPLSWSHYIRLLSVENNQARQFYETEAIRGSWSIRQLNRQVNSMFFERTALSKNKAAMLTKGLAPKPDEIVSTEEQIRDPLVLEFLNLKNEYAESDLEDALIHHLEEFLLELGGDFTFVARQRRLRLDDKWFKVDLVFFHRRLRSLIVIDLKIGEFSHTDAGQMNMYLNYARANWMLEGENPPIGLILCAQKGHDEARYALEGLGNKVLTRTFRMTLPEEKVLIAEIERTRRMLENRSAIEGQKPKEDE